MAAQRMITLAAAHRELETIYERLGEEPAPDGERLLKLEDVIISQPADSLAETILRVRALIAMRRIEGAADDTLLVGLHTLLDDLIRLSGRSPGN